MVPDLRLQPTGMSLSHSRPGTTYRRSMPSATSSRAGGLMSYGTDRVAEMGQAASYLDRILRGAGPATCRCRRRPSSRQPSTSRPPRPSVALAARHHVPAVYAFSYLVAGGGLMSYGFHLIVASEMRSGSVLSRPHLSRRRGLATCRCRRRPSSRQAVNLKTAKDPRPDDPANASRPRRRGDRVRRRAVLSFLGAAAVASPLPVRAQRASTRPRIGVLLVGLSRDSKAAQHFQQELRALGYSDGRDVVIEWRSAEGDYDRVPRLVAELVQSRVDVIVLDSFATEVTKRFTSQIPIVMALVLSDQGSSTVWHILAATSPASP